MSKMKSDPRKRYVGRRKDAGRKRPYGFGLVPKTRADDELCLLVSFKGRIFPMILGKEMPRKLAKMAEGSAGCGGGIGNFMHAVLAESKKLVDEGLKSLRCDSKGDGPIRWGFKVVPDKESEEGNVLYRLVDAPIEGG